MHAVMVFHHEPATAASTRTELCPFYTAAAAVEYFNHLASAALYARKHPERLQWVSHSLTDVLKDMMSQGHTQWELPTEVADALARYQEFEDAGIWGAALMRGTIFRWDSSCRSAYVLGRDNESGSSSNNGIGSGSGSGSGSGGAPVRRSLKRLQMEPVPVVIGPLAVPDVLSAVMQPPPRLPFAAFGKGDKVMEVDEMDEEGVIIRVDTVLHQFVVNFSVQGLVIRRAYELVPVT